MHDKSPVAVCVQTESHIVEALVIVEVHVSVPARGLTQLVEHYASPAISNTHVYVHTEPSSATEPHSLFTTVGVKQVPVQTVWSAPAALKVQAMSQTVEAKLPTVWNIDNVETAGFTQVEVHKSEPSFLVIHCLLH